jgi:hypothetical protein
MDEITRREYAEIERRLDWAGIPFRRRAAKWSGRPVYDFAPEHLDEATRIFAEVKTGHELPADYAEQERGRYAAEQRAVWNGKV